MIRHCVDEHLISASRRRVHLREARIRRNDDDVEMKVNTAIRSHSKSCPAQLHFSAVFSTELSSRTLYLFTALSHDRCQVHGNNGRDIVTLIHFHSPAHSSGEAHPPTLPLVLSPSLAFLCVAMGKKQSKVRVKKNPKHKTFAKGIRVRRRARDIDQIQDDIAAVDLNPALARREEDIELPGLGQHYCLCCASPHIHTLSRSEGECRGGDEKMKGEAHSCAFVCVFAGV